MHDSLLFSLFLLGLTPQIAMAQITPDASLGNESSVVETKGDRDTIKGGAVRDNNLLHSFQEFSIETGKEAYFANPNGIDNIFSRVTGNSRSNINGVLGVSGNANLYLINPNGIIFGRNARLDVNGSFFATTADSILFDNGAEFSATNPNTPPLLTVDIPIGLRFRDNPGDITNQANFGLIRDLTKANNPITSISGLEVDRGKNITFVGGDIFLEKSGITAPGGNVDLGGLSASGIVGINSDDSLSFPENIARGNVFVSDSAKVNVRGENNGFITVNANNLTIKETGSELLAGIDKNSGFPEAVAGDILINANNILLENGAIANQVKPGGQGSAGDINIFTNSLTALDSFIGTDHAGKGEGNAGHININARDTINLDKTLLSSSLLTTNVRGNAGNINLESVDITLQNNSQALATSQGIGNAGNINLTSSNSVTLDKGVVLSSQTLVTTDEKKKITGTPQGNAGDITIVTSNFFMRGDSSVKDSESFIISNTDGIGKGGNIKITANNMLTVDAGDIVSGVEPKGVGKGGDIYLNADTISLTNGSNLSSGTLGDGDAGNIKLETNSLELDKFSNISSNTRINSEGNGGTIEITAKDISILNESSINAFSSSNFDSGEIKITATNIRLSKGGTIFSGTNKGGRAGNIELNILDEIFADGEPTSEKIPKKVDPDNNEDIDPILNSIRRKTGLLANTTADSQGGGGNITIGIFKGDGKTLVLDKTQFTNQIDLKNSAVITANSKGGGGTITVYARNLDLDGGEISATTEFESSESEKLSEIKLFIDDNLTLRNNSLISAEAQNDADGGNVSIESDFIIAFPSRGMGSDIRANADEGTGGRIDIRTNQIFGLSEKVNTANLDNNSNDIDASSEFGISGEIAVTKLDVDPNRNYLEVTPEIIDASQIITQNVCQQTRNSKFVDIGKGGLPLTPQDTLTGTNIDVGLVAPMTISKEGLTTPQEGVDTRTEIERTPPARGWIQRNNGIVELVAYNPHQLEKQHMKAIKSGSLKCR